jgi:atypical dual specificity phosphatase
VPGLFVGDITAAESAPVLAAYRITHVLSAMRGAVHVPAELALRQMHVPLDDLPFSELAEYLPETTAFIRDALRADPAARVLVHCVQGVSRSASVAAAYLIARYGWTASQAVQYIKSKRAVDPNLGFLSQLQEYEKIARLPSSLSSTPSPTPSIASSPPPPLSMLFPAAC